MNLEALKEGRRQKTFEEILWLNIFHSEAVPLKYGKKIKMCLQFYVQGKYFFKNKEEYFPKKDTWKLKQFLHEKH